MFLEENEEFNETPVERLKKLLGYIQIGSLKVIVAILDCLLLAFRKINTLRFFILVIALCSINLIALIALNEYYLEKDLYKPPTDVIAKDMENKLNQEILFLRQELIDSKDIESKLLNRVRYLEENPMTSVVYVSNGTSNIYEQHVSEFITNREKHSNDVILRVAARSDRNLTVLHVVSHTHWNREKYLPQLLLRTKLVNVFEEVMMRSKVAAAFNISISRTHPAHFDHETEFQHFHLDGQSILAQDFLDLFPEYKEVVVALNKNKLLSIGPWYVEPGEFLVSGEAIVRNLMFVPVTSNSNPVGMRMVSKLGGVPSTVGYLVDNAGHIAQLPQIYKGFNINVSIVAKGSHENQKREFWWQSPDGTKILNVLSPNYCYGGGTPKLEWYYERGVPSSILDWWNSRKAILTNASNTNHLLLMNGCDHTTFDPYVLQNIGVLQRHSRLFAELSESLEANSTEEHSHTMDNSAFANNTIVIHSSLQDYAQMLTQSIEVHNISLNTKLGEMRVDETFRSSVYSNKLSFKISNWELQTLLERWVEPYSVVWWKVFGGFSSNNLVAKGSTSTSWSMLLENHAYHSITGATDSMTQKEIEQRFAECKQLVTQLAYEPLLDIVNRIDFAARFNDIDANFDEKRDMKAWTNKIWSDSSVFTVFNPLNFNRSEMVLVNIEMPAFFFYNTFSNFMKVEVFDLDTEVGKAPSKIPAHPISPTAQLEWDYVLPEYGFRKTFNTRKFTFAMLASVPSFGYKTYRVRALLSSTDLENRTRALPRDSEGNPLLESQFLIAAFRIADGTLTIYDKLSGLYYYYMNQIQIEEDSGNSYQFVHFSGDTMGKAKFVKILYEDINDLSRFLKCKYEIRFNNKTMPFTMTFVVSKFDKHVKVRLQLDNKMLNYRLRAVFPTQCNPNTTRIHVDAPFDVLVREPEENITAYCCDTFQSVVNLFDAEAKMGIAVAARGIKEYDTVNIKYRNSKTDSLSEYLGLAVTLLRPTTEVGDWGTFPTDTSSELKTIGIEYIIIPNYFNPISTNGIKGYQVLKEALSFNNPMLAVQHKNFPGKVKSRVPIDLRNTELGSIANDFWQKHPLVEPKKLEGGGTRFIAKVDKDTSDGKLWLPSSGVFIDFNTTRVLLSTIKRAETRDSTILRLWNPYRVAESVTLKIPPYWNIKEAYSCQLNEDRTSGIAVNGNGTTVQFTVFSKKIYTLELV